VLTPEARDLIRQHRAELLAELRGAAKEEWGYSLADLAEMDRLIHRLCDLEGFPDEIRARMLDARRRMAPAIVPAELANLRRAVGE
jgi:hypothetical protein